MKKAYIAVIIFLISVSAIVFAPIDVTYIPNTGLSGRIQVTQGSAVYDITQNDQTVELQPEAFSFKFKIEPPAEGGIFVGNVEQKDFYSNTERLVNATGPGFALGAAALEPQQKFFFANDYEEAGTQLVSTYNFVSQVRCHSYDAATKTCTWTPNDFGGMTVQQLDDKTLYVVYLDEMDDTLINFKLTFEETTTPPPVGECSTIINCLGHIDQKFVESVFK